MYERFTDRARKVMQLADAEAKKLNHEYIGTEHVLLGLLKEGNGVAAHAMKAAGFSLDALRVEIVKLVVPADPESLVIIGRNPHTPRTKQAIAFAIEEAKALGHNYVGTEHLLLGLLREPLSLACQVMNSLGIRADAMREAVMELLGKGKVAPSTTPPIFDAQPMAGKTRLAPAVIQQMHTVDVGAHLLKYAEILSANIKYLLDPERITSSSKESAVPLIAELVKVGECLRGQLPTTWSVNVTGFAKQTEAEVAS